MAVPFEQSRFDVEPISRDFGFSQKAFHISIRLCGASCVPMLGCVWARSRRCRARAQIDRSRPKAGRRCSPQRALDIGTADIGGSGQSPRVGSAHSR